MMEDLSVEQVKQQFGHQEIVKHIEIDEIETIDLEWGRSINSITYKVVGAGPSGKTFSISSKFVLPKSSRKNFIPFDSVTKETAISWVKSLDPDYIPTESKVNETLTTRVESIKNPWG